MGLHSFRISDTVDDMTTITSEIANRVRGVAAEKHYTQAHIAQTLGLARSSVSSRMNAATPFTGTELASLAFSMNVNVARFFPTSDEVSA